MKNVGWVLVAILVMCGTVLACQATPPAPGTPAASGAAPVTAILLAALNGALVGFVGWLSQRKAADGTLEKFDPVQLVATIIVGALIGAVAAWRKKSFADMETWVENSGYITLGEIVLKAVWRNASVTLQGLLSSVKSGEAANPTSAPGAGPATPQSPVKPS